MRVDAEIAGEFLREVHGGGAGRGELVLYCQRGGGRHAERRQVGVDLGADAEIEGLGDLVERGFNVYVTPCRFASDRVPNTRRQRDVVWGPGVWADLDLKPNLPTGIRTPAEMDRVLAALPQPTLLVDSGSGGRHPYWLLDGEGTEDVKRLRRLTDLWLGLLRRRASEALEREIQLDGVGDLSRVLRLPGTWRHPIKTDVDGIQDPRPVRLLASGDRRWTLDGLEALIPADLIEVRDRVGPAASAVGLTVDPSDQRVQGWVESLIRSEATSLAALQVGEDGGRNARLNRGAFVLGTLGAHGLVERDRAFEELVERACGENGLLAEDGAGQCDATFSSGWDSGSAHPRVLPDFQAVPEDADTDEFWPSPQDPREVARRILGLWQLAEGGPWVRYWRGSWMRREVTGAWTEVEEAAIRKAVYDQLGPAVYQKVTEEGEVKLLPWQPNLTRVNHVIDALKSLTLLPEAVDPPSFIGPLAWNQSEPARGLLVVENGILNVETRALGPHDPKLFTLVSVPFRYDREAWTPTRWLAFLEQLWPDDPESQACLQEVFGYVLSGWTDLQKIPLIVGPTRAGKGVIAGVLKALIGPKNVVGVSLNSLKNDFGLQPLLDKPLALISDARLGGETTPLVERLLSISGEDTVTVDRKYKSSWTGRLPTRFLVVSNELPNLADSSGAVSKRFVVMILTRSWYGQENPRLGQELLLEMPGILNWSLDGLDRLARNGRFTEGTAAADARQAMEEAGSPLLSFVRECCQVGEGLSVPKGDLYDAWQVWAITRNLKPSNPSWFSRELYAVAPSVTGDREFLDGQRQSVYRNIALRTGVTDGNL